MLVQDRRLSKTRCPRQDGGVGALLHCHFVLGRLVQTNTGREPLRACVLHGLGQAETSVGKSLAHLLCDCCSKDCLFAG